MTIKVTIKGDVKDIARALNAVGSKAIVPSTVSALNKTIAQVQTKVIRDVASATGVPQYLLRGRKGNKKRDGSARRIVVVKATYKRMHASLIALTQGIPLIKLNRSAWRGKPGMFKATMPSGHVGIFKRKSRSRLPIQEQFRPIAQEAESSARSAISSFAPRKFRQLFEHELIRRLRRLR